MRRVRLGVYRGGALAEHVSQFGEDLELKMNVAKSVRVVAVARRALAETSGFPVTEIGPTGRWAPSGRRHGGENPGCRDLVPPFRPPCIALGGQAADCRRFRGLRGDVWRRRSHMAERLLKRGRICDGSSTRPRDVESHGVRFRCALHTEWSNAAVALRIGRNHSLRVKLARPT